MPDLDREGNFRVRPIEWTLRENDKTGSVNLSIKFVVIEQYAGDGEWSSWAGYDEHEVYGNYNIVKKDGKLNETTIEQLMTGLGWDGDFGRLTDAKPFEPWNCQVRVEQETYNNQTRFRAGWLSHFDNVPGAPGIDAERAGALQTQYGGQLRAIASNIQREAAKPAGSPTPPAPTPVQAAQAAQAPPEPARTAQAPPSQRAVGPDGQEIPF